MTEKNKGQGSELKNDPAARQDRAYRNPTDTSPKRIRKVSPLGMRVLVRIERESNVTDSGLYLPEGAKQSMMESLLAEVIEVASATDIDTQEETNVSGVPLGAKVLIAKTAGISLPWDELCRLVDTKDILAIVDEVNLV